jgi:hypothetical protein
VVPDLRGDDLLLEPRQQSLCLVQGQTQIGDIAEIIGPVDFHDVQAPTLALGADLHQPQNPGHSLPQVKERRENAPVARTPQNTRQSRMFRGLFLHYLEKAFAAGALNFFSAYRHLHEPSAFRLYLVPVWNTEWVIYAKLPFAGPAQVLDYVGRYTQRVAISNSRLVSMDNGKVTFRWKDYRDGNHQKVMTLDGGEFIRRFLVHVLPGGFQRIRYFGFLGNRHRARKLEHCRGLLDMAPGVPTPVEPPADYRDRFEALTGPSLRECPHCHKVIMVVIGCIARPAVREPAPDTS